MDKANPSHCSGSMESVWQYVPDNILLNVFSYMNAPQLLTCSCVCQGWYRVAQDEFLWKDLVINLCSQPISRDISPHFTQENDKDSDEDKKVKQKRRQMVIDKGLPPNKTSWRAEYKRLFYHTPVMLSETLTHEDEVWHVSFSRKGDKLATCCKGGYLKVWNVQKIPAELLFLKCMGTAPYEWNDSFMSQFSFDDSLLLVTGDKKGSYFKGDVAIFDTHADFRLLHIIPNSPYDVFGTWFSGCHILVGTLHILGYPRGSVSELRILEIPKTHDEEPKLKKRFRFRNIRNFVRCVLIANIIDESHQGNTHSQHLTFSDQMSVQEGNDNIDGLDICESHDDIDDDVTKSGYNDAMEVVVCDTAGIQENVISEQTMNDKDCDPIQHFLSDPVHEETVSTTYVENSHDNLLESDKLLIFTWGHKNNDLPHEVAIKRLSKESFDEFVAGDDNNVPLEERPLTEVDHIIDLEGHIVGLRLSPDHRYLYVNCRQIDSDHSFMEDEYPQLSEDVVVYVIDLVTMQVVTKLDTGHKGYTQESVFYLYLDVNDRHILSGSENNQGYLWDRHYEVKLTTYGHTAPVCCAALNSKDSETLATASDDHNLKIWRSRHRMKQLNQKPANDE